MIEPSCFQSQNFSFKNMHIIAHFHVKYLSVMISKCVDFVDSPQFATN